MKKIKTEYKQAGEGDHMRECLSVCCIKKSVCVCVHVLILPPNQPELSSLFVHVFVHICVGRV